MKFKSIDDVKLICDRDNKQYLVYENMVLDVEKFQHPGPQELITENIGTDCTELFNEQGHSKSAIEMCQNLKVGFIQGNQLLENQWAKVTQEEKEIHEKLDAMIDIKKPLIP